MIKKPVRSIILYVTADVNIDEGTDYRLAIAFPCESDFPPKVGHIDIGNHGQS